MEVTLLLRTSDGNLTGDCPPAAYEQSHTLVLLICGELDTNSAGLLDNTLSGELSKGARRVILDLSDMDYVSSVGLRTFLSSLKKLKADQGRMVLTGLNEEVQEIFDMAGFSALFEITPNLDKARTTLAS
jgi:anti-anti-sigma factor